MRCLRTTADLVRGGKGRTAGKGEGEEEEEKEQEEDKSAGGLRGGWISKTRLRRF